MTIADRVTVAIVGELGVSRAAVTPEARFIEDLGADSLDRVSLALELEAEFDIEISDDEIHGLLTVAEAVAFIEQRTTAQV